MRAAVTFLQNRSDIDPQRIGLLGHSEGALLAAMVAASAADIAFAGGHKDVTTVALPNLNHLLQTRTTGLPSEYGTIEETVSPDVLKLMADWIVKRTS